jgi:hypothetical protein
MARESRAHARLTVVVAWGVHAAAFGGGQTAPPLAYQGQLKHQGQPANLNVDLRFALHSTAEGESPVGTPIEFANQPVTHGLFSVELAFPTGAFDGGPRWLQVEVRTTGSLTGFTTLTPRQPMLSVPYAYYAFGGPGGSGPWEANGDDIFNTNTGGVGVGESSPAGLLHITTADVGLVAVALHQEDAIVEDADAVLGLYSDPAGTRGSAISLGEIDQGALVDKWSIVRNTSPVGSQLLYKYGSNPDYGSNATRMVINPTGEVGIGTSNPAALLDVTRTTSGFTGSFKGGNGVRVETNFSGGPDLDLKSTANSGFNFGLGSLNFVDGTDTNYGGMLYRRTLLGDRLVLRAGQQEQVYVDQDGRVGIGETTPAAPLHVVGTTKSRPAEGDAVIIGARDGEQLALNENEIVVRDVRGGGALYINRTGGSVFISSEGPGALGVGTSAPAATLDVNGGAHISGDLDVDGNLNVGGAASISIGYEVVTNSRDGDGGSENISVGCPPGKKVLGGGCFHSGNSGTLTASHPAGDDGWACFWDDTQGAGHTVQAEAICANID